MISATLRACSLSGVASSSARAPCSERSRAVLKVARRTWPGPGGSGIDEDFAPKAGVATRAEAARTRVAVEATRRVLWDTGTILSVGGTDRRGRWTESPFHEGSGLCGAPARPG